MEETAGKYVFHIDVNSAFLSWTAAHQYSIFDLEKSDKLEKLDRAVDKLRGKYGEDAVFRASFLKSNVSHMSGGLNKERVYDKFVE